jgi:hypothetical protein
MRTITAETIGNSKPWVAKITGTDPKFGLKREFVNGTRDYSKANSVKTRGVMTTWILDDGIYECNLPQSWKNTERFFTIVTDDGYQPLTAAEVTQKIKEMEVVNA